MNPLLSFLTNLQSKFLKWRVNREIYDSIMAHNRGDGDHGHPFQNREQMMELTEQFDVQALLADTEAYIAQMPTGYGRAFRYIMHRDLRRQVLQYHLLAKWEGRARIAPTVYASKA